MIKIVYFASVREKLGLSDETIALPNTVTTVAELSQWLQANRGEIWASTLGASNIISAVNQERVDANALLKDGDEVAFFPPVTGG